MDRLHPHLDLYPPIAPFGKGMLRVSERHQIYWEQSGDPEGTPVVFLHGGPGAGASPAHRRFFDPDHYRTIIFDQRGAGRSTPLGETRENTTEDLIADIEALREALNIRRWHVFGGSWGSTLALAYAQSFPERCLSLILRGIFLMRKAEIDWFLYQMRAIFPEAWADFVADIPADERDDLLKAYLERLNSPDRATRLAAARSWSVYEGACSTLRPNRDLLTTAADDHHALGLSRIEAHYFQYNRFEPEDLLLRRIDRIREIPAVIVQGRYDIVCPIRNADELHRAWPEADYVIVPDAGHSAMEPGIRSALLAATERFKLLEAD